MRRDLECAQVQALQDLQKSEEGRRFERDDVARPRHRPQAQGDRLEAAVRYDDVARVELTTHAQRMAGDRAAQALVAVASRVLAECRAMTVHGAADRPTRSEER